MGIGNRQRGRPRFSSPRQSDANGSLCEFSGEKLDRKNHRHRRRAKLGGRISCGSRGRSASTDRILPSVFPRLSSRNRWTRPRRLFRSKFDSASRGPARKARPSHPLLPARLVDLRGRHCSHLDRHLPRLHFLCLATANSARMTNGFSAKSELTIWCCRCDSELLTRPELEQARRRRFLDFVRNDKKGALTLESSLSWRRGYG